MGDQAVRRGAWVVALSVSWISPPCATASVGIAAGVERDAPAVFDRQPFPSQGWFEPRVALWWGWPVGPAVFRAEGGLSRRSFGSTAFATSTPITLDACHFGLLAAIGRDLRGDGRIELVLGSETLLRLRARRRVRDVQDVSEELHEADPRLVGGLRLRRPLGALALSVEARYMHGLTNLDATNQQSIRSRAFSVMLGVER